MSTLQPSAAPSQHTWTLDRTERQRTRRACDSCRVRKRKCDGNDPCRACVRDKYECRYTLDGSGQRRRRVVASTAAPASKPPPPSRETSGTTNTSRVEDAVDEHHRTRHIEANSGGVFARAVGLQFDPERAPAAQALGWNLDLRPPPPSTSHSICSLIGYLEWLHYFDIFVAEIHPLYDFLDLDHVRSYAARRWTDTTATSAYDHVLTGAAALGSLFSASSSEKEIHLAHLTKELCHDTLTGAVTTTEDCEGWLLHTLYLRCSSSPHAAWIASCNTMHVIEAANIYESKTISVQIGSEQTAEGMDAERRRRLFWLARLLNNWISNEYGRSAATMQSMPSYQQIPKSESPCGRLLYLASLSQCLDPSKDAQVDVLGDALKQAHEVDCSIHNALVLSQTNLTFTIYRRLRAQGFNVPKEISETVLRQGRLGLAATERLIEKRVPWWHVSNVPFQFACVLLAMDDIESAALLQNAKSVLLRVVDTWTTALPARALETVQLLVQLSAARKRCQLALLENDTSAQQPPTKPALDFSALDGWNTDGDDASQQGLVFPDTFMQTINPDDIDWNLLADPRYGFSNNDVQDSNSFTVRYP